MKLCLIAGARPNFMKIAPIIGAINRHNEQGDGRVDALLVHTGQHYDQKMSRLFFENLDIPAPDIDLQVGSASHAAQTAEIMKRFETVCVTEKPTHVLVVGDVNSTIACALVATKLGIKVVHVEAGLRSFDRAMPEEINRLLTDAISDYLFTTEESANENLRHEGISDKKIHFVGNVMIDTLFKHRQKASASDILDRLGLNGNSSKTGDPKRIRTFCLLTLHRPSNVDSQPAFERIIRALKEVGKELPVIFPVHPRTAGRIEEFGFQRHFTWPVNRKIQTCDLDGGLHCLEPLGYLDFLQLMSHAKLVLTDSGGIQEETTILGIPCVTLRENTERPVTVTHGTNRVVGTKREAIIEGAFEALNDGHRKVETPPLWDGKAAERIVEVLVGRAGEH